jgi:2-methylcitrate dehydratase PrpD
MSGGFNVEPIVNNLKVGDHLAVYHAAMKRFPVNASQHSPIELLDHLVRQNKFEANQVKKITAAVNEGVLLHGGTIYQPKEVIEAQFSLRFSLALRLLKGNNDLQGYLDSMLWHDPAMLGIGRKIELVADPKAVGARRFACRMTIRLNDGSEASDELAAPKGNYRNPLSKDELTEKFRRLAGAALDLRQLNQVIDGVDGIERAPDVATMLAPIMGA